MLTQEDKKYIEKLIKDDIKNIRNSIAGIKHFLEYKINIGTPDALIQREVDEIKSLEKKIESIQSILTRLYN